MHVRLGAWDEAAADIASSREAAHVLGDAGRIAAVENLAGVAEFERGNWHEASRRFAAAREYAGVADDPGLLIEIESNDGRLWDELGDAERAADSFRWALSRFETFDASKASPRLLCNIGIALASTGRHGEADAHFERALVECKQRLTLLCQARAQIAFELGGIEYMQGSPTVLRNEICDIHQRGNRTK